jgi:hypothetical protein
MTSSLTRNLAAATLAVLALPQAACAQGLPLDRVNLPPGFEISVYAQVPSARSLALGDNGTVFVGNRRDGGVYAIVPREGDKPEVLTIGCTPSSHISVTGIECSIFPKWTLGYVP